VANRTIVFAKESYAMVPSPPSGGCENVGGVGPDGSEDGISEGRGLTVEVGSGVGLAAGLGVGVVMAEGVEI
jgi:hypothetical protein